VDLVIARATGPEHQDRQLSRPRPRRTPPAETVTAVQPSPAAMSILPERWVHQNSPAVGDHCGAAQQQAVALLGVVVAPRRPEIPTRPARSMSLATMTARGSPSRTNRRRCPNAVTSTSRPTPERAGAALAGPSVRAARPAGGMVSSGRGLDPSPPSYEAHRRGCAGRWHGEMADRGRGMKDSRPRHVIVALPRSGPTGRTLRPSLAFLPWRSRRSCGGRTPAVLPTLASELAVTINRAA